MGGVVNTTWDAGSQMGCREGTEGAAGKIPAGQVSPIDFTRLAPQSLLLPTAGGFGETRVRLAQNR